MLAYKAIKRRKMTRLRELQEFAALCRRCGDDTPVAELWRIAAGSSIRAAAYAFQVTFMQKRISPFEGLVRYTDAPVGYFRVKDVA